MTLKRSRSNIQPVTDAETKSDTTTRSPLLSVFVVNSRGPGEDSKHVLCESTMSPCCFCTAYVTHTGRIHTADGACVKQALMSIMDQIDPPRQTANISVLFNAFETFCFPQYITDMSQVYCSSVNVRKSCIYIHFAVRSGLAQVVDLLQYAR